jgi:isopentenyl phosphate kinase
MRELVVIKLGGSALTDKSRIYTPRLKVIHRVAQEVSLIRQKAELVLVHGAGSFGHIPAKRYDLQNGYKNFSQLSGLAATKVKLLEWQRILDTIFLSHGVSIIPFFASDMVETTGGRIRRADLLSLRRWIGLGCVPMVGGDIVPDSKRGFSIVSGDQLAVYLAIKLSAARLVFGVDVDGVFDGNPKSNRSAKLLPDLDTKTALHYATKAGMSTVPDVTGGMAGKISEGVVAARHGVSTYFVNLTKINRLQKAALGQAVIGSRLKC